MRRNLEYLFTNCVSFARFQTELFCSLYEIKSKQIKHSLIYIAPLIWTALLNKADENIINSKPRSEPSRKFAFALTICVPSSSNSNFSVIQLAFAIMSLDTDISS